MGVLDDYRKGRKCSDCNPRSTSLNSYISSIESSFKDSPSYFQIYKNFIHTTTYDTWILENTSYKNIVGMKTIIMYPYQEIDSGDYIEWIDQDEVWLAIGSDDQYKWKQKGYIEYCNDKLRWFDANGVYHESYCVIEERIARVGFADGNEVPLPNNTIQVKVQQNINTYNIPINWRFIFGEQVFRVTVKNEYVNDDEEDGVLTLTMEKDEENSGDDFVNKIADNGTYTIEIVGGDITNDVGYTQQLSAIVRRDDEVVSGSVTWESSDDSIVTVDNTGLVTFVAIGNATITAKLNDYAVSGSTDNINCTVQAVPADNYEIVVSPDNGKVIVSETETYNVKLLNNGVDTGQTFVFSDLTNGTGYNFVAIDGNNFSVENVDAFSGSLSVEMSNINKTENYEIRFSPW